MIYKLYIFICYHELQSQIIILLAAKMHKSGSDEEDEPGYIRTRNNEINNIRKINRDEIFTKKRMTYDDNDQEQKSQDCLSFLSGNVIDERYAEDIYKYLRKNYTIDEYDDLVQDIQSGDTLRVHHGVIGIRRLLTVSAESPIQRVIDSGLVITFLTFIDQDDYPQLKLQAIWAITNIASGSTQQCSSIIEKDGIKIIAKCLKESKEHILEHAVWAIGNLSCDSSFYRDSILKEGVLEKIAESIEVHYQNTHYLKHSCWTLSNLCRGNPLPEYDRIKPAIPVLCKAIASDKIMDVDILSDCLWAISYFCDGMKKMSQPLLQNNLLPKIIPILQTQEDMFSITIPIMRIIGCVATGTKEDCQVLLSCDLLKYMIYPLRSTKKSLRRECCWTLSNVAASVRSQVQRLLLKQDLMQQLIDAFESDEDEVRRECCYVFGNITFGGQNLALIDFYLQNKILINYVSLLHSEDNKTVEVSLDCLFNILNYGEKKKDICNGKNLLALEVQKIGGIDILEELQYHQSTRVYHRVNKILESFFEIVDPLTESTRA